jgi:hypothetical protein
MIKTSMIALVTVVGLSSFAAASPIPDQTFVTNGKTIDSTTIVARKGADDPKGHNRGGEGAGHASLDSGSILIQLAKHGADDKRGHG